MDGGLCLFLIIAIPIIIKAVMDAAKRREVENLRHTNPEMYMHLKQIEHEERMLEHDKKRMRHDSMKTGANIVASIFRVLTKR